MSEIDPRALPYDEQIATLTRALDQARANVTALESELEWWRQGRELFGSAPSSNGDKLIDVPVVAPPGAKPTLAQAIVLIIAEQANGKEEWSPPEVMNELRSRSWMPNGKSAEHVVRARIAQLARGDDAPLRRVGHGVYTFNPPKPDVQPEWE